MSAFSVASHRFTSVLTVAALVLVGPASVEVAAVVAAPRALAARPVVRSAPDAFSAMVAARRQGIPVEIADERTDSTMVVVNPDGSRTLTSYTAPMWVHQADGSWADIDTTLVQHADGSIGPKVGQPGVGFSGATSGSGWHSFARLGSGAGAVSWLWRGPLPAPTLSGDTATYGSVSPGVNLVVRATRTGFESSVVFTARPRGPVAIPMAVQTGKDVTTTTAPDGSVTWSGPHGMKAVSPAAGMWDSSSGKAASSSPVREQLAAAGSTDVSGMGLGDTPTTFSNTDATGVGQSETAGAGLPGTAGQAFSVAASLPAAARAWWLTPSPSFLSASSTTYPVTVDPTVSLGDTLDTWVSPSTNYFQASPNVLYVGYNYGGVGPNGLARSFIKFDTSAVDARINQAPITILGASLQMWNTYSSGCGKVKWDAALSDPFDTSTVWNSQPGLTYQAPTTSSTQSVGSSGTAPACSAGTVSCPASRILDRFV